MYLHDTDNAPPEQTQEVCDLLDEFQMKIEELGNRTRALVCMLMLYPEHKRELIDFDLFLETVEGLPEVELTEADEIEFQKRGLEVLRQWRVENEWAEEFEYAV
jgi:hypothetical protein